MRLDEPFHRRHHGPCFVACILNSLNRLESAHPHICTNDTQHQSSK